MSFDKSNILARAKQVFADELAGLKTVSDGLDSSFTAAVETIFNCRGKVVVMGMGKSGHIGGKIAATLASTGTPAFFVHPAEALHGDLGMIEEADVIIAISYSGESDELIALIPALRRKKVPLIAITGEDDSSLGRAASHVLSIKINKEACPLNLAPTTSTTVALVIGDALAVSLLELRGFGEEDFALSHPGGSLGRKLLTRVSDIMHAGDKLPKVLTGSKSKDVVMVITRQRLGFAGVVDRNDNVVGIVTDGDLRRVLEHDLDINALTVDEMMTHNPKVLRSDDLAVKAIDLMEVHRITMFLVVDAANHLVGAFNLHDLFAAKLL